MYKWLTYYKLARENEKQTKCGRPGRQWWMFKLLRWRLRNMVWVLVGFSQWSIITTDCRWWWWWWWWCILYCSNTTKFRCTILTAVVLGPRTYRATHRRREGAKCFHTHTALHRQSSGKEEERLKRIMQILQMSSRHVHAITDSFFMQGRTHSLQKWYKIQKQNIPHRPTDRHVRTQHLCNLFYFLWWRQGTSGWGGVTDIRRKPTPWGIIACPKLH